MSQRSTGSVIGGVEGGPVSFALLVGCIYVVWSLVALSILLALGAIAFVGVCIFLLTQLDEPPPDGIDVGDGQQMFIGLLLLAAILAAFLIYPLTVEFHLVPFAVAGWTVVGLFYASLLAGAWIVITTAGRILAMLAGAAAVAAMVVLPPPQGATDPADKESEWQITLTVLDEKENPIQTAVAQCSTAMVWNAEGAADFDLGSYVQGVSIVPGPAFTGETGEASFTFKEDMRLKVAVCTALKLNGSFTLRPTEEDFARADYPPKSVVMASPIPGGKYELTLRLEPRKDRAAKRTAAIGAEIDLTASVAAAPPNR